MSLLWDSEHPLNRSHLDEFVIMLSYVQGKELNLVVFQAVFLQLENKQTY